MIKEKTLVSYIGEPSNNTAMYISKKVEHLLSNLESVNNCLIFCESTIDVPEELELKHKFVMTDNPQLEYIKHVTKLANKIENNNQKRKYRLTNEGYYIGENVKIGSNSYIEPQCLIGHDVVIGENASIRSGVKIKNTIIGNDFIAYENATIGMSGFNFSKDEDGNQIRVPSLGKVVIGNHVEVGMLTNIAVGTASNTVISDYVKTDGLVHIAHDVKIDKNVELCAGVIIGGYVSIGRDTFIGVNATLRNRVSVGNHCFIGMGSAVMRSLGDNANVLGNPARVFKRD